MRSAWVILAACCFTAPSAFAAPTVGDSSLIIAEVASGLSQPTTIAFIGDDDLLVLQKNDGRVRRVIGGIVQPGEVLDVAVDNLSERGLLGIALHPQFPLTPFVYLYFTESSTETDTSGFPTPLGNRVYRYTWNGANLVSPTLLLDLPVTSGPNHDGGIITFGPDAKLYVVIGDLNRNGQLQNIPTGPPPDDTGVILRLNDDGTIPSDNPFASQGGNLSKYYAYGIRNSFGMAFDPLTRRLWMSENGPDAFDEINLVQAGFNSGWKQIMGPDARDPQGIADLFSVPGSQYSDPKFSWLRTVGPTALSFLGSNALGGQYQFDLFVGDINFGNLYRFRLNPARDGFIFSGSGLAELVADSAAEFDELLFGTGFNGITDIKVGPDGRLYVVSFGDGKIYALSRSVPNGTFIVTSLAVSSSGSNVRFNRNIDLTVLNLYDTESGVLGPPDLSLTGAAQGAVRGSVIIESSREITFIKTGGPLAPDTYTLTLRSAANGFKDTNGNLLDGNGAGTPGGDYVATFVVTPADSVILSMPDFAYGPGQTVNVPFDAPGLPVILNGGVNVTTLRFRVRYDPALLTINAVVPGESLPPGSTVDSNVAPAGTLNIRVTSPTGLGPSPIEVTRFVAAVPQTAPYGLTQPLSLEILSVGPASGSAVADDAIHAVAYIGDTTGNQAYSSLDAQRVLRVAAGLDSGFAAYPLIDPVIIGDTTWNGSLSSLDATRILQEVAGIDRSEIPPIPGK